MEKYREIYAVDFDGTLSLGEWPEVGKPNVELFEFLKERQAAGDIIILWTCREGDLLDAAVSFCECQGLEFDAVNEHTEENKGKFGGNPRKIFAHYYIDDKSVAPGGFTPVLPVVSKKPKTNIEKIKEMNSEELGDFLNNFEECDCCKNECCCEACAKGIAKWLESEEWDE